jgi:hypothetical protein
VLGSELQLTQFFFEPLNLVLLSFDLV